jgi:hypothetical protein
MGGTADLTFGGEPDKHEPEARWCRDVASVYTCGNCNYHEEAC